MNTAPCARPLTKALNIFIVRLERPGGRPESCGPCFLPNLPAALSVTVAASCTFYRQRPTRLHAITEHVARPTRTFPNIYETGRARARGGEETYKNNRTEIMARAALIERTFPARGVLSYTFRGSAPGGPRVHLNRYCVVSVFES